MDGEILVKSECDVYPAVLDADHHVGFDMWLADLQADAFSSLIIAPVFFSGKIFFPCPDKYD